MTTPSEAFAPLAGSNDTVAQYSNPFGFTLQVIQSTVNLVVGLANNGTQVGLVRFFRLYADRVAHILAVKFTSIQYGRRGVDGKPCESAYSISQCPVQVIK
jgi:hypothetical protein